MFCLKRIIAFLLSLLMYASILSFGAFADPSIDAGDINIDFNDIDDGADVYGPAENNEGYVFIRMGDKFKTNVEIKSAYEGKPVVAIGNAALENAVNLTEVVVPGTVKSIGGKAFSGCTALKQAVIPDSVDYIDPTAFEGCDCLTVYGNEGSAAETFAKEKGFDFLTVVWGDANADRKVTALDLIRYKIYLSSDGVRMGIGADTNGDNVYDAVDVARLRNYFAEHEDGTSSVILGPQA